MSDLRKLSIREFFSLLGLNFVVQVRNLFELFKVAFKYYSNFEFFKADLSLRLMYLFHNPFSISKRFLIAKGESNIYAYGETPLTTLEKIVKESDITKKDCVYELGCGRGRTCFWLRSFIGCKVVGIEMVPEFVDRAKRITKKLKISNLQFELNDICTTNYDSATVIYLYGTCLEDHTIGILIEKFAQLPIGTKIITVSYPLNDFTNKPNFEIMKCFTGNFAWGETEIYLNVVKKGDSSKIKFFGSD
ncbi:MAG: class I SAM-dependent methyltransferase [Parachlamydiaceae bacterium]|nr:class I SAM-dependent methyltransferase [Parachlamydiaceae bacterium]